MKQDELRRIRESLGLSQEKFANLLKVSLRTVHNWECGRTAIPETKVDEIEKIITSVNQTAEGNGINAGRDIHHVNSSQELNKMLDALNESLRQNSRLIGIIENLQKK